MPVNKLQDQNHDLGNTWGLWHTWMCWVKSSGYTGKISSWYSFSSKAPNDKFISTCQHEDKEAENQARCCSLTDKDTQPRQPQTCNKFWVYFLKLLGFKSGFIFTFGANISCCHYSNLWAARARWYYFLFIQRRDKKKRFCLDKSKWGLCWKYECSSYQLHFTIKLK